MVFSSSVFLFLFLPSVWLIYTLIPQKYLKAKNIILAVASLIFYAFGEPIYILLMLFSILFNYYAAIFIEKAGQKGKNILCVLTVSVNLLMLGVFKYSPWLVSLFNSLFETSVPVPSLTIPIGISFYTFQILSYVVDVKRGKIPVQRNVMYVLLYIAFFPQLIAGPIVRYEDIADQIEHRQTTAEGTARGIRRFVAGLGKKIIISNTVAVIADAAFAGGEISSLLAWLGAVAYCIQLYFDFSGYSDMAIGLASLFGFKICENFNYPYSAVSIRDFWKRWHISLTTLFREYVYIPLGGNRRGSIRTVLNRVFVFFLTGLWHGASFTFVIWGLWHGLLMMFEKAVNFDKLSQNRFFRPIARLHTLLAVCLGFVLFRAPSISAAFEYIATMFRFNGNGADALIYFSPYTVMLTAAGVLFSAPILKTVRAYAARLGDRASKIFEIAGYVVSLPLLLWCIMQLASSEFNPFIYYNF